MNSEKTASIIAKGTGYIFVGVFITYFLGIFFRIFIAQTLGAEALGIVSLMIILIGIFSILFNPGLNAAITKYISSYLAKKKNVDIVYTTGLKMVLLLAIAGSIVLFLLSEFIAINVFNSTLAIFPFQLTSLAMLFNVLALFFTSSSSGFQRMENITFTNIVERGSKLLILIILVYLGFGVMGPAYAIALSFVLATIISWAVFRHQTRLRFKGFDKKIAKMLLIFGAPMMLVAGAGMIFTWTDSFLIGVYMTVEEVGFYSVAVSLYVFLGSIVGSLTTTLFPVFSSIEARDDIEMLKGVVNRALKYTVYLILPASLGLILLAEPTIRILFGSEFYPAIVPLQILLIGSFFLSLSKICHSFIIGIGRPASYTKFMIISGIINIALNVILIPFYGLIGAAIATTSSLFLSFLLTILFVYRRVGLSFRYIPTAIVATSIMLLIIYLIRAYLQIGTFGRVVAVIIIGLVVYFYSLNFLRGFDKTDKKTIKYFYKRIRAKIKN